MYRICIMDINHDHDDSLVVKHLTRNKDVQGSIPSPATAKFSFPIIDVIQCNED